MVQDDPKDPKEVELTLTSLGYYNPAHELVVTPARVASRLRNVLMAS
jgi:hypothetical protein